MLRHAHLSHLMVVVAEWIRRHPLLVVTTLLLTGIVCGYRLGMRLMAACGAAVALITMLICVIPRRGCRRTVSAEEPVPIPSAPRGVLARTASFLFFVFFLGWLLAAMDRNGREREARYFADAGTVNISCRVGAEVVVTPYRGRSTRQVFTADSCRLEGCQVRRLPVTVTWFGAADGGPQPGELWRLRGRGKVRRNRSGLLTLAFQSGEDRSRRLERAESASWRRRLDLVRRAAARRVTLGIEGWGDIPALNQAMLLGSRHEMPPAKRRIFVDSGTIHVFAISGLHIVLVAAVLTLAVSVFGVPQLWWVVCVGPPLIFYTFLTGARPSAVRACLMALLYMLAPLLGRRPNGVTALAGTAITLHLLRPWLVYDIGSVLSFSVMGGLVVFCRPFCELAERLCGLSRLRELARMLRASGESGRARRIERLAAFIKALADSFAVSLAAFAASLPLTAHYFGRFTPGGLLANLIIGPCAFMIVVSGCLGVATSFLSYGVAACFNNAAGFFTWVMIKTAELTVALPGASHRIVRWRPWAVWLWFGMLALLALWLRLHPRREDGFVWLEE